MPPSGWRLCGRFGKSLVTNDTQYTNFASPLPPATRARLSRKARAYARERFAIGRFVADWNDVFHEVTSR